MLPRIIRENASRRVLRAGLVAAILFVAVVFVVTNWVVFASPDASAAERQADLPPGEREALAPETDDVTVYTAHMNFDGKLVAIAPNGTVLYFDGRHDGYWDVDPEPDGERTVLYTASDRLEAGEEGCDEGPCIRQYVERANLTTGETETLYTTMGDQYDSSEWHDADRIDEHHVVVADMAEDRVFVVNHTANLIVWEWDAQQHFDVETGGPFPEDWTHLNDVEVLPDGLIQVSMRNHDQVVYLDPETGVREELTLGTDDDHDTLYEQHNPDYVEGGENPAVLIADSESNRVVEYERRGDEWERTWVWQDEHVQWPRDADRLPNGNTLVADSHGGRVIEVDADGEVVWELDVQTVYEAERLDTGDESAGGQPASELGLESRERSEGGAAGGGSVLGTLNGLALFVEGLVPPKVINGALAVSPWWMTFADVLMVVAMVGLLLTWLALEAYWSPYSVDVDVRRTAESPPRERSD